MKTVLKWLVVAHLAMAGLAHGQAKDPWIGKRVFTQYGTVLKVGNVVVDDEGRSADARASGKARGFSRVYRVEHTNGEWLWLKGEESGISGWVQSKYVIPYEQAIDFYTNQIRSRPTASLYCHRGNIWLEKKEYDIAIADYNEAIRAEPGEAIYFSNRGNAWAGKKEYGKALADYNEAIRLDPRDAQSHNNRAWLWATCPDEEYRDGKRAVESATRACELGEWKEPNLLGTLAAAYAESGDFDRAVELQEKKIKIKHDPKDMQGFEDRLKLYKEKKPYRDTEP
jgi:tetratricopeptide (TPR) repeat protein